MALEWEGYQPHLVVLTLVFCPLSAIAVGLRFLSRHFAKQALGVDDWLILAALVFTYVWCTLVVISSQLGHLGGHTRYSPDGYPITETDFILFGKTTWIFGVLVTPTLSLIKLSIAFLYKRIFATYHFQRVAWTVIIILITYTIGQTLACIFACWPLDSHWYITAPAECVDLRALYLSGVVISTFTDFLILLAPMYNVWQLQMPLRRKVGICIIFAIGGIAIVTGIVRMVYLIQVTAVLTPPPFYDYTYEMAPTVVWCMVEINLGIICACLPMMLPVWSKSGLGNHLGSLMTKFNISSKTTPSKTTRPSYDQRPISSAQDTRASSLGSKASLKPTSTDGEYYHDSILNSMENGTKDTPYPRSYHAV